jgi:hypothetical protein
MPPPRKWSTRFGASIVVLTFLAALVGAYRHRATVQHGYCSDHGQPIHLDRAARAAAAHTDDIRRPQVKGDAHVQGAHDCLSQAFLAQGGDFKLGPGVPPRPLTAATDAAPPLSPAVPTIDLLHLAPSQSPPPG